MAIHINDLILPENRIVFGCTLKNFAIDFGDQEDTYTATLIQEPGQTFGLENFGIDDIPFIMTNITIANTEFVSILEGWEKVSVDINGTGIFNVTMKMPGNFFTETIDIYADASLSSYTIEGRTLRIPINTLEKNASGVRASEIFDYLNNFIFSINNIDVRFNFDNITSSLPNLDNYRIRNLHYTLLYVLSELSLSYEFQYSFRTALEDNILTVYIETDTEDEIDISDLDGADTAFDYILSQQSDKIISLVEGFESVGVTSTIPSRNDLVTYYGGSKQELLSVPLLKQFWGFDKDNNLLLQPTVFLNDNLDRARTVSYEELEQTLTGELNRTSDRISSNIIAGIFKLKENFWGKRFVVDEDEFFNAYSLSIDDFKPTELGWSETNLLVGQFIKSRSLLQSEDGRFVSFIQLPDVTDALSEVLDQENWDEIISSSSNVVKLFGIYYMAVSVERINGYIIVTLPVALTYQTPSTTTETNNGPIVRDGKLTRIRHIDSSFLAMLNTKSRYGPFKFYQGKVFDNSQSVIDNENVSKFNIINIELVPWNFSDGQSNNTLATNKLVDYLKKQETSHSPQKVISPLFKKGSIEVADLPLQKIMKKIKFPYGIAVDRIGLSFGLDGFKTIYKIGMPKRSGSNNRNERNKDSLSSLAKRMGVLESRLNNFVPKLNSLDPASTSLEDIMNEKIDEKLIPIKQELKSKKDIPAARELTLGSADMEWIYKKPEGGQGIIVGSETGPFYTVRRINYADIDSQTFAGGLNISESYFLSEWQHVRNLSEDETSPGYLLPGTKVNVSIFSDSEFGPFVPYMEHTPETFAPPIVE